MDNTNERFVKVSSGAVYRYSPALAKRRDAMIVDGYVAAQYYRSLNVENDITKAYPERDIDKGAIPEKPRRPARDQSARGKRGEPKSKVIVTEDEPVTEEVLDKLL